MIVTGCGENNKYTLKASVNGDTDATYRLITYTPRGPEMKLLASRKEIFEFEDTISVPVMVEVLSNDYTRLGLYWAEAGDEINITVDPKNFGGFEVSGTEINDRLNTWLKANKDLVGKGPSEKLNEAIAKYVGSHPDDPVSTMLMAAKWDSSIDPAETLKMWTAIDKSVRPAYIGGDIIALAESASSGRKAVVKDISFINQKDTLELFRPVDHRVSVMAFTDETVKADRDSIAKKFKELRKEIKSEKRLKIIDYSLDNDTRMWRAAVDTDSVTYTLAWSGPGRGAVGIAELSVGQLPFFIVADSTGRQIYRGNSLTIAVDSVKMLKP